MPISSLFLLIGGLAALGYMAGRRRARAFATPGRGARHSLPGHYGVHVALWCAVPAGVIAAAWLLAEPRIIEALAAAALPDEIRNLPASQLALVMEKARNLAAGVVPAGGADSTVTAVATHFARLDALGRTALAVSLVTVVSAGALHAWRHMAPGFRARVSVERAMRAGLFACATVAVITTLGIVLSLVFEAARFFAAVSPLDFLFGLAWSPQTAIRADQVAASGSFGAVPLFAGTALIALIAMAVATPIGLFAAIYMAEYAPKRLRATVKPVIEMLAGIPTVVYGFFAALTVAPALRALGDAIGLDVASESALAAGLVMGIMIIPFVSSLADDAIAAVPRSLREGSLALGATRSETIREVVLPAALPGIAGGVLLAVSRAIGETMIVVMAAGMAANLTANPLEAVTTVTVQIVALLTGDQAFDSPKTLSAFALALVLFAVTLALNLAAMAIVRRFRERYD